MEVKNPRHPHKCMIYRMAGTSSFEVGQREVLYDGPCRKYNSGSLRTFKTDGVIRADYALSVPGTVGGIRTGDLLDVTDRGEELTGCLISDCYAGNLGTTIYFNRAKN